MGPIGWPETVFIFFLALILFGPKKLPELGRTVGKALADFQKAKGEIQAAFDRETKQLVQDTRIGLDTEMLTGIADRYRFETSAIDATLYGEASLNAFSSHSSAGVEAYASLPARIGAPACDEPELQAVSAEDATQGYIG